MVRVKEILNTTNGSWWIVSSGLKPQAGMNDPPTDVGGIQDNNDSYVGSN
jgi:hypothetical protein